MLEGTECQAKGLRPQQIQHVSKPAEAPDVPLVPAHAHGVDLAVDEQAFLVVQRQALQLRVVGGATQPLVVPLRVVDVGAAHVGWCDDGGLAVVQDGGGAVMYGHGEEGDGGLVVCGIQGDNVVSG